jgi:hypothetical protein
MNSFGTIIQYCTNDYRFIDKCIAEAKKFSDQIVIPVCDHFFNGQPENRELLTQTYRNHPDCDFIEFAFTPDRHYSPYSTHSPLDEGWIRLWHQTSRYIGWLHLRPEIDFLLFLDCDEIPEGERVAAWLQTGEYRNYNALRFLGFYYALRPTLRAKKLQSLALLVKRACLEPRFFIQIDERHGLYQHIPEPKKKEVRGGLQPLFHHYSWVRPQSECLHKAGSWGHSGEKNWSQEIEKAFEEKGFRDLFGHVDLEFEEIPRPYFDPFSTPLPEKSLPQQEFSHVKKVTPRDIFQLELEWTFGSRDNY